MTVTRKKLAAECRRLGMPGTAAFLTSFCKEFGIEEVRAGSTVYEVEPPGPRPLKTKEKIR